MLWNFNEFVGQLFQFLQGEEGSTSELFGIKILQTLLDRHPEYFDVVDAVVTKKKPA